MRYRLLVQEAISELPPTSREVFILSRMKKFTEQGNCFAIGYFCKDCGISYHPVVETVAGAAERLSVSLEFFVKKKPYLSCLGMAFFFISYTGIRNYNLHLNRILC